MKAYISVAFKQRQALKNEINTISTALNEFGIEAFVFVDHYKFTPSQEREMMEQAMKEIDGCDFLVAETSYKAIGIGVEAGYAKGRGKPVIYVRQRMAEHSTTVAGLSDCQVVYEGVHDLKNQLVDTLKVIASIRLR